MKTILTPILLAALATATPTFAADEVTPPTPAPEAAAVAPATTAGTNDGLRLNFRGVDLEQVLNYLSDAAGFIIVLDAKPRGKVDVWSNTPLTKDEAVDLLNSVLNKNGLASIRNGRTLTIVDKLDAKTRNIKVIQGGDPGKIPNNDEIVTQIIPVRFVEVGQLTKDLMPLVPTTSTMIPNESGNSILMTDTQANIRRVAEIIQAIDQSAEDVTEVEVFRLQYADPTEMATLLTGVFPDDSKSSAQSPIQVGRGGARGGRGGNAGGGAANFAALFGAAGGQSANGQNARIQKRARVIAVPDARTQSVIVSAASGLMAQIKVMVTQLDSNPAKKQNVYVYSMENADPQQVLSVVQEMFETTTTSSRNNNRNSQQNNPLANRANQTQTTTSSTTSGARRGGTGATGGTGGGGGF